MKTRVRIRRGIDVAGRLAVLVATAVVLATTAVADPADSDDLGGLPYLPSDSDVIRPLPMITPTPSAWQPMFPFPYDQTRNRVTEADITAMREMCQWYNAQYVTLRSQIDRLQFNRIGPDGQDWNYARDNVQQQVDIVSTNLLQAVDYLTPRAQALTRAPNSFGDLYFPIYEGEAFFKLWEQLFNVRNGILAHQPAWFTGPSVQKAKRWGSDIHRSHVCQQA